MPILVGCAGCGAQLRVRDEYIGRPMRCPKCGLVVETDAPIDAVAANHAGLGVQAGPPPLTTDQELASVLPAPRRSHPNRDEEDDQRPVRGYGGFSPCPRCGGRTAERVVWTAWGSFYGPALLNHVRCVGCGYKYNGRNGRSNWLPAAIFVMVPLILIVAVIGTLAWWLWYTSVGRRAVAAPAPASYALVSPWRPPSSLGTG